MRKPKIAFVLTQDRGGPVDLTVALAKELSARDDAEVVVLGPPPVTSAGELGELHRVVEVSSKTDLQGMRRLRSALREEDADVVHAQDRRSALAVVGLRQSAPVVATYHGVPEAVPGDWAGGRAGAPRPPARDLAVLTADAAVARRVQLSVAPSQAIADFMSRRLRAPRARLVVVPNGVPLPPAVDLPEQVHQCLFVGLLVPRKAADVLLDAFALVAPERPLARLRIVGDGPERARLELRAQQPDLAGRVEFSGYRTDVPDQLRRAHVFVLPSHNENQPLALLEAMGAGLACIATGVGGVADVLVEGAGTVVPPGEVPALAAALARVLEEPGLAAAQGRRAAAAARASHSIARCADEHLGLYRRVRASRA